MNLLEILPSDEEIENHFTKIQKLDSIEADGEYKEVEIKRKQSECIAGAQWLKSYLIQKTDGRN